MTTNKISNLTQKFGVLVDTKGTVLGGYPSHSFLQLVAKPSHWKFCSWKLKHDIDERGLFLALANLFRCDGKCNTNNGDDQEWYIGSLDLAYHQIKNKNMRYNDKENTRHDDGYPGENLIQGDKSIFNCVWGAKWRISDVSDDLEDLDKAKMGLCKPFKTLLENCSIPIGECIGDIAVN